jgi:hypothetical protein
VVVVLDKIVLWLAQQILVVVVVVLEIPQEQLTGLHLAVQTVVQALSLFVTQPQQWATPVTLQQTTW